MEVDKWNEWRGQILDGLGNLPATGAVPGTIIIWGENARSILTVPAPGKPTIIAGSVIGRGRLVAVAHDGLLDKWSALAGRLELWLSGATTLARKHVLTASSRVKDISTGDMLLWKGSKSLGDVTVEFIIKHITEGGSLLHSMCPWGWLQLNPGKCLSDMPLAAVLEAAGMFYTGKCGSLPGSGIDVTEHHADDGNHVLFALNSLLKNPIEFIEDAANCKDLQVLDLSSLPKDICCRALGPKLSELSRALGCDCSNNQQGISAVSNLNPCPEKPLSDDRKRALVDIIDTLGRLEFATLSGVDCFLGCLPVDSRREHAQVIVKSRLADVHPTGYYLPRGETLHLNIEGVLAKGWSVQIGAHTDNLTDVQSPLRRWPQLVVHQELTGRQARVHSPYGGLVYLCSPKLPSEIRVGLKNVVEAPLFNMTDENTVNNWHERRQAPGLWADICGENIMITLPSASVRDIDNPGPVMEMWDRVVRAHHDLRGTDPDKHRRQWVVTDEQPSAGYMHSGYPIVTHLDQAQPTHKLFLLNHSALKDEGNWGLYHEIGHNMQRSSWTFEGTGEVTCNIFTLHAMHQVSGQSPWIHEWLQPNLKRVHEYLRSGSFSLWQSDPGLALFIYAQIVHSFGWDIYKKVFRQYEQDGGKLDGAKLQEKIDVWCQRASRSCGKNLIPLFDFWKIPISSGVMKSLEDLIPFIPDDEVTKTNTRYTEQIRSKYPGILTNGQQ